MARHVGPRGFFWREVGRLIEFARWEKKLSKEQEGGSTYRAHLEMLARSGSEKAKAELEPPGFPESIRYLWDWAKKVHGRSGVTHVGFAPLSFEALQAWTGLMGFTIAPHETEALMTLDSVLLYSGKEDDGNG